MQLLKEAAYINGKWVHSNKTFEIRNPYDGKIIARVPNLGGVECEEAIDAAYQVYCIKILIVYCEGIA